MAVPRSPRPPRRRRHMLETREVIAFAGSADMGQARAFYEQTLGLRMIEQSEYACVFDANGTMLRVTAVGEVARARLHRSRLAGLRYRGHRPRPHRQGRRVLAVRRHGPGRRWCLDDPGRGQGRLVRRSGRKRPVAHPVRVLTQGIRSIFPACALRFAPVRSSGSRMPCRERAVELVRTLGRTGARGAGPVCSSVHGSLTKPVPIPASRPALRTGKRPVDAQTN